MPKPLLKRIAKTTGTTVGEAKGIMANVRKSVATGDKAGARKTVRKALSGGPSAGVKRSPARTAKARTASKKIVSRVAANQKAKSKVIGKRGR